MDDIQQQVNEEEIATFYNVFRIVEQPKTIRNIQA